MRVSRSLKRVNPKFDFSSDSWAVDIDSSEYAPIPETWSRRQVFRYLSYKALVLLLEAANRDGVMDASDCELALEPYAEERGWEKELGHENK